MRNRTTTTLLLATALVFSAPSEAQKPSTPPTEPNTNEQRIFQAPPPNIGRGLEVVSEALSDPLTWIDSNEADFSGFRYMGRREEIISSTVNGLAGREVEFINRSMTAHFSVQCVTEGSPLIQQEEGSAFGAYGARCGQRSYAVLWLRGYNTLQITFVYRDGRAMAMAEQDIRSAPRLMFEATQQR
ncbi:hypothetical protein [Maricaulis sp.]|uniref:hypothetical protein n=1 Tax=Maricaulis sp. TaxID=1486257 RepID=UPI003A93DDFA